MGYIMCALLVGCMGHSSIVRLYGAYNVCSIILQVESVHNIQF